MGCSGSSSASVPRSKETDEIQDGAIFEAGDGRIVRGTSTRSTGSTGSAITAKQSKHAHERLRKLRELDAATKIPFILVELRGIGHGDGYVEVCGKDEYGVYAALHDFLVDSWGCQQLDAGCLSESTPVPFSDSLYRWTNYKAEGDEGCSNMGLATMRLVDFMTNELCWTLGVINGGNVGEHGEIREQQVIFKAPHPLNMAMPHIMIELRSAGYIEVCGKDAEVLDEVDHYLQSNLCAKRTPGHEHLCDRYYQCGNGVFKEHGACNNLGLLTTRVCDEMVRLPGWSLVTMNGGNYGETGTHREQQLVFRKDSHPLREQPHLLVEMRDAGFIEVNGQDVHDIYAHLHRFLKTWGCTALAATPWDHTSGFCDKKYKWQATDMLQASAALTGFFHSRGWQMQVCSQGTVKHEDQENSREQQILFRPGSSGLDFVEPHLFIELYMGEGDEKLYHRPDVTQVLGGQHMRISTVGECGGAVEELHRFVVDYLGGSSSLDKYGLDIFMSRGMSDNNMGCWTMRMCDFMVDRLGWSFVVCNVCNMGETGHHREQQLVFRYDGERRHIPVNKEDNNVVLKAKDFVRTPFPSYWKVPKVLSFRSPQGITPCEPAEIAALQEMVDHTFKRVLTRDRVYEPHIAGNEEMPFRLEIIHAFRSENAQLYHRFAQRRLRYTGGTPAAPKTREVGSHLNNRLADGEALLFHGTNPSSAMGILKTGFQLRQAGKTTGTMFGYGVYLAESSSKADEYACDDGGGSYPQLNALLVCRTLVGRPYIVHEAGDHVEAARNAGGYDCVLGDRESKVGTFREFVFFDESQVLPEYTIIYRREYNKGKVPEKMQRAASGSTRKNWQVKMERGWLDIPPGPNQEILALEEDGQRQFQMDIGSFTYLFDLEARTQTNLKSGTVRQLRPPMVKSAPVRRSTSGCLLTRSSSATLSPSGSSAPRVSGSSPFRPSTR
eukprot:TRINITY_DN3574_c0_g2_i6.p1 TRINITY_DN3574_c0_g2~~TRINITY_DN3574_c0_g2_i6.p1  ORF type:complete len:948 (+),score=175.20 TRINITY_DN3574_c0_g2_i6:85-2928(+)